MATGSNAAKTKNKSSSRGRARSSATAPAASKGAKGKRGSARGGGRMAGLLSVPSSLMGPRLLFVFCVAALCVLGLVMVYSASSITAYNEYHNASYYFDRQVMFLGIGVVACVAIAFVPHRVWANPVVFSALWLVSCALLSVTAFGGGISALGAERSIRLPGGFSLQPSEFAKVTVIIALAALLEMCRERSLDFKLFLPIAIIATVVPIGLLYKQPDLGTALILAVAVLAILVLAGVQWKWIALIVVLVVLYGVYSCVTQPYHLQRILAVLEPWADPLGDGYHTIQSLYAFGSGGVFGTGLGLSRQKYLYLPYAHTDFIFSVIGEELGLVGTIGVVALFALLVYAGLRIARTAPDLFGCLAVGGMAAMIGFQAFVNMGQACGMLPVTGKALPFLSYGGSSIIATLLMCGFVLSVSIHSSVGAANERRRDNLRVYDGGRSARETRPSRGPREGRAERGRPRSARRQPGRGRPRGQLGGQTGRRAAGGRTAVDRREAPGRHHRAGAQIVSIRDPLSQARKGAFAYGRSVYARRRKTRGGA